MKVYIVYGVYNLLAGFNKIGFNKCLLGVIIVLFATVLKLILYIILYINQLKIK